MLSVTVAADVRGQQMKLNTPFGKPAFLRLSTKRYWVYGLDSEAFRTTVLPQMRGVMNALIPRICPNVSDYHYSYVYDLNDRCIPWCYAEHNATRFLEDHSEGA